MWKFIAALFARANFREKGRVRKCPAGREIINKLWYFYTTEYYSAIGKNKLWIYATVWMNLKIITLNERSPREWITCCRIPFLGDFRKWKLIYSERKQSDRSLETIGEWMEEERSEQGKKLGWGELQRDRRRLCRLMNMLSWLWCGSISQNVKLCLYICAVFIR